MTNNLNFPTAFSHLGKLRICFALMQMKKAATISELSTIIGCSYASTTSHLSQLEQEGFVKMEIQPTRRIFSLLKNPFVQEPKEEIE